MSNNNFIRYDVGGVSHIRPVPALKAGGLQNEGKVLTLYFPRTPPLIVRCPTDTIAQGLMGVLVAYMTDSSSISGLPGYSETLLDLNTVIEALEAAENKLTASEPSP